MPDPRARDNTGEQRGVLGAGGPGPGRGLPAATIIATIRGVDQLALVFLVNLIGAPAGIGWLAALILAFGPRRLPPQPPPAWLPPPW
jgi:hypothetical protein